MESPSRPEPPYWAVIFSSTRTPEDQQGYDKMAARMAELAVQQPGCLGFDSTHDTHGCGITVSYWQSLEAIESWRDHPEHKAAQAGGREKWYAEYDLHIARVERTYSFKA